MQLARLLLRVRAADARDAAAAAARAAAQAGAAATAAAARGPGWPPAPPHACAPAAVATLSDAAPDQERQRSLLRARPPDAFGELKAQQHDAFGELKEVLSSQGLSHSAVMTIVGWAPSATQAARDNMVARAAALQQAFGREHANRMLVVEPALLNLTERRVRHNFEGVKAALGLTQQQAMGLVRNHPTMLRASMALLKERHAVLKELLQLDEAPMRTFLLRAPSVLRLADGKLASQMAWLQEAGGVGRAQVVRAYRSWPQLATTSTAVLQDRYDALRQLLGASPADMRRVVSVYPNLLARDPGALRSNATSLAALLGASECDVQALLRKEPGLLSYNMSTLATRWSYTMQVLRLPREMGLTLLTVNRPLLSVTTQLPDRIEGLRRLLGATDEQLYPLLHKHVALLRYPTDHAAAKLAAFDALTSLHPAWAEARERQSKQHLVRVIMGSWGCLYRLAYMIATGQAAAAGPVTALRAPHALFARTFPDYPDWLDRYNQAVGPDRAVPSSGSLVPMGRAPAADLLAMRALPTARWKFLGGAGPDGYDHAWQQGAAPPPPPPPQQQQQQQQQHEEGEGREGGGAQGPGLAAWPGSTGGVQRQPGLRPGKEHSGPGLGSSSGGGGGGSGAGSSGAGSSALSVGTSMSSSDSSTAAPAAVEASQDAILAHWLGIPRARVQEALAECPALAKLSWSVWQAQVDAAEALIALVRGGEGKPAHEHSAAGEAGPPGTGGPRRRAGEAEAAAPAGAAATQKRAAWRAPEPDGGTGGATAMLVQPVPAGAARGRAASAAAAAGAALLPCPAVAARARELMAAAGTHPATAAALAAAANLAPFSPRLWRPPLRASAAASGALLDACPKAWASPLFAARCRWLCALAASSPCVLRELREMPLGDLARAPLAPRAAFEVLQYLVAERRPRPWPFSVREQLARPRKWAPPATFLSAHPGFGEWLKGMRSGSKRGGGDDSGVSGSERVTRP